MSNVVHYCDVFPDNEEQIFEEMIVVKDVCYIQKVTDKPDFEYAIHVLSGSRIQELFLKMITDTLKVCEGTDKVIDLLHCTDDIDLDICTND